MKKFSFIVIFIAALFLTGCSNSNVITEIDYNKLEDLIKNEETFILEITQTGCSHCQEFSPRFKAILKTNDLTAYNLNLYNMTKEEQDKFNDLTTVTGTPTVLFFKDGKEMTNTKIVGALSNDEVKKILKRAGFIEE